MSRDPLNEPKSRLPRLALAGLIAGAGAFACKDTSHFDRTDQTCLTPVVAETNPLDTLVAVGMTFTPRLAIRVCPGYAFPAPKWIPSDSSIVSVDEEIGTTFAKAIGEVDVSVRTTQYGVIAKMHVRVGPAQQAR